MNEFEKGNSNEMRIPQNNKEIEDPISCILFAIRKIVKFVRKNECIDFILKIIEHLPHNFNIRVASVTDFYSYCKKNNRLYYEIEPVQKRLVFQQQYFEGEEEKQFQVYTLPIAIAALEDVEILGGSGLVFDLKQCIFDRACDEKSNRYDFSYDPILCVKGHRIVYFEKDRANDLEKGIFLLGFFSFNYFHITVEILSKLKYVDDMQCFDDYPIIIDEVVAKTPQFVELLQKINVKHHEIVCIEKGKKCRVHKLVYVTDNVWIPWLLRKDNFYQINDFGMAISAMTNISTIVKNEKNITRYNRKVYLSRQNCKNIRLKNELEIAEMFRKIGFEIIFSEELSLDEQIKVFSEAGIVVGMAGAAFTNIIYCNPGTSIVCFSPQEHHNYLYCTMARLCGLDFISLDLKVVTKQKWLSDELFEMDEEYCGRFIDWMRCSGFLEKKEYERDG